MTIRRAIPGERVSLRASDWNSIAEASDAVLASRFAQRGGTGGGAIAGDVVLVKNLTGVALRIGSVVAIGAPIFTPSANLAGFLRGPALSATTADAATAGRFAIMAEPTRANALGRAIVSGIAVTQVEVIDPGAISATEKIGDRDKLVTAAAGNATIIWRESGTSGTKRAVVRLGGFASTSTSTWVVVAADLYSGSNPKRYRYSLKRSTLNTANGLRTVDAASQLVYAHNLFEDSNTAWGHGQDLTPATGATLSVDGPVQGPVGAWFTGYFHADGTPLYEFEALTPMGATCT